MYLLGNPTLPRPGWKTVSLTVVVSIALVLFLAACASAGAQWGPGGVRLSSAEGYVESYEMISDGAGGCFSAWWDNNDYCLKAQRLDSSGKSLWTGGGTRVNEGYDSSNSIFLARDGRGGLILSWGEYGGHETVHAQRMNSTGNRMWGANGVVVCDAGTTNAVNQGVVSDSAGGAIVLVRVSQAEGILQANRLNENGTPAWGSPVQVTDSCNMGALVPVSDGCIVAWQSAPSTSMQILAQKLGLDGSKKWAAEGVSFCNTLNSKEDAVFASDGANGVAAAWAEPRGAGSGPGGPGGTYHPYAQRISASGARLWGDTAARICDAFTETHDFSLAPDGSGGALVCWVDLRDTRVNVYAQKVSATGAPAWDMDGISIYEGDESAAQPVVVSDGSGGLLVAYDVFDEGRYTAAVTGAGGRKTKRTMSDMHVYVQQVLASGMKSPGWAPSGMPVVPLSLSEFNSEARVCSDGTGGAIVVFMDGRDNAYYPNLFAQRMKTTTSVWYLAEGSSAWGFDTHISIENPNTSAVDVKITYMLPGGQSIVRQRELPAVSQTTIRPEDDMKFATDFSTRVECLNGLPIAVDRTMEWTGAGAQAGEAHSSIGVNSPTTAWYLAEGCSGYGFETWLLVQNPGDVDSTCTITYMIEGGTPKSVIKKVPGRSRQSFNMAGDIGAQSSAMSISSDVPVIVERSMYRDNRREGHETVAAAGASTDYYLAEGTTAWGFTTYVLVQNPNSTPCFVSMNYMTPGGPQSMAPFSMPPFGRATVKVNDQLPGTDFSTQVHSDQPIVAERAMYWTGQDPAVGEATHDTIGLTCPASLFYFPDGETSGGRETFTLVQNPGKDDVRVKVTYMKPDGKDNVTFEETVPAMSRITFNMRDKVPDGRASTYVQVLTRGGKVMAERSMYSEGRAAGTCTIGGASD